MKEAEPWAYKWGALLWPEHPKSKGAADNALPEPWEHRMSRWMQGRVGADVWAGLGKSEWPSALACVKEASGGAAAREVRLWALVLSARG